MRIRLRILAAAVLTAGCSSSGTQFNMHAGPELTWHPKPEVSTAKSATDPGEQARLAEGELRQAELKDSDEMAVAEATYSLAVQRRRQGDLVEAERLYRQALDLCERAQGRNGPDVAVVLTGLAALKASQGDFAAAEPLFQRALDIRQMAFGDTPLTAESMSNLALLYAAEGNAEAAEPLYSDALTILDHTDGASREDLAQVLDNYAALLRDTGREEAAAEMEARAGLIRATRPTSLVP